ncbi:sulfotransferase family 2 domain-containing protein [Rhodosalinus halophilus]|uniref:sulfotransferase family 2 domain-containing protein n=1 Tax=Rhodosalinus halophilus TaxID=2259333 RepID=UPI0013141850|nr:sulfotransferase family 2 domain-containing protein [Rhodosalinus halophilus]
MGWRGYIDRRHGAVFFWSQKAACTTLFELLADNMRERPAAKRYFHSHSTPGHRCRRVIEQEGLLAVILARHPASRAVSAYINKFCLYRGQRLETRAALEPFAQDLHDRFVTWSGGTPSEEDANVLTFEQFLETVARMQAEKKKPWLPINGHWETQVPPGLGDTGFRYDEIVHVERLEEELSALAGRMGMKWRSRTLNRSPVAKAPHQGYLGDIPARDVASHAFGHGNFLSDATLARIAEIYAPDYDMFGYPLAPEA